VVDEEPKATVKAAGRLRNILAGLGPWAERETASIRRR
jgi:hypothetical protein